METDPLSVILVKSDSKGDRLLFRYPYEVEKRQENGPVHSRKNPYAISINEDLLKKYPSTKLTNIENDQLSGLSDEVLSNLFAVKLELCDAKFELKANDVRFVSHPILLKPPNNAKKDQSGILINVVFALRATASHSIVKCYYELSKRIGIALGHEEFRCGYFSEEMKIMVEIHDKASNRAEEDDKKESENEPTQEINPFDVILQKSSLCRDLRQIYDDLCTTGYIKIRINTWILLSFCLPQKVHQLHNKAIMIEPGAIDKCLESIKPFHGLLFMIEAEELLNNLVPDASPGLIRLIKVYTPLKSIQTLAADADLTLRHVFELSAHLVYWGRAIIIYPICENNIYITAPDAPVDIHSPLVTKFAERFPDNSLLQVLGEFNLPISLRNKISPFSRSDKVELQMIIWLLQHRLLMQLHTYVFFMPPPKKPKKKGQPAEKSSSEESSHEPVSEPGSLTILTQSKGPRKNDAYSKIYSVSKSGKRDGMVQILSGGKRDGTVTVLTTTGKIDGTVTILGSPSRKLDGTLSNILGQDISLFDSTCSDSEYDSSSISKKTLRKKKSTSSNSGSSKQDKGFLIKEKKETPEERDNRLNKEWRTHTCLMDLSKDEKEALKKRPIGAVTEDLCLLVRLIKKNYLKGDRHIEDIMYLENLKRSEVIQLIDKFHEVLIIYESEDQSIAMFYPHYYSSPDWFCL